MTVIFILALTHIGAFVAGVFTHRFLAKKATQVAQTVLNTTANTTK